MLIAATLVLSILAILVLVNFSASERRVEQEIEHLYPLDDPQFRRAMALMLGPTTVGGNSVRELINGDQIFPAMLEAIRGAQRTILFETFIYWSGKIGTDMAAALSARARDGVKVHVLLDWVGSTRVDRALVQRMKEAGVEVEMFHPLRWYNLGRMNNRTHRKLLIVDGVTGFTGGVGIAPQWTGNAQDPDHWRDSHFHVEGPVVAQMQSVMLANWSRTTGRVLHGSDYFPEIAPAGEQTAQMFSSSPSNGSETMLMMVLIAITAATRTIDIASAYFIPDEVARRSLESAVRRGVRVRIVTPGVHTDQDTVRHASRSMWGGLLQADVEMYEYQPTMFHCKAMIVDELMTSVGSTNFDPRSFHLNDEANLNIYDAAFARRMTQVFEADLQRSRRITLQEWRRRPLRQRVRERLSALLTPIL